MFCFLTLQAFDKVCHTRLKTKLHAIGFNSVATSWIMVFLRNGKQLAEVHGHRGQSFFSEITKVTRGVPQDTVLGPMLFNICINNVLHVVLNKLILDADDSKITDPVKADTTLQADIDSFSRWADRWCLELNIKKCKTIHFGKTSPIHLHNIGSTNAQPQPISAATEDRDLGLIIDNKLKFTSHTEMIVGKASQRLGLIKQTISSRVEHTLLKLYKALVQPVIEYRMSVASPINRDDVAALESIQQKATKCI